MTPPPEGRGGDTVSGGPRRDESSDLPLYEQLKAYIRDRILAGDWPVDHKIPSENELVRAFGASRMTVNRAVREMTEGGWLRRVQGQGTFVSDSRTRLELLEIRNVADIIRARGAYRSEVVIHEATTATGEIAEALRKTPGARIFHSRIVHFLDDAPFQLEERYVNPTVARDYMDIDLSVQTPNEYLMRAAPLSEVEHRLEAILPDRLQQELLRIGPTQPCLHLHRRTWSAGHVASRAWLTHPGDRFYLSTRFSYEGGGERRPERST